jgi:hypothetical protein
MYLLKGFFMPKQLMLVHNSFISILNLLRIYNDYVPTMCRLYVDFIPT